MSKLDTATYKGVRDFYPEDQFIENYIFSIWKKTAEKYGYEEYNASILEPSEIYKEKSGEEIVKEQTFTFIDRGGRDVTLRPEMTPSLARMVAAKRRELGYPLRLYSVPNLFRYEAPQRGRLREHWQFNADIFGIKTIEADVEIITLAYETLKAFGAKPEDFEIRLNTHGPREELDQVILILNQVLSIKNTRIDETLKRGQAYYTGVVYEFFDTDPKNHRSIFGGGRYDGLTKLFEDFELPAVGIASGDVSTRDFLETHKLLPKYNPATKLFLILKKPTREVTMDFFNLANDLRNKGINLATDVSGRELADVYKAIERLAIPYVGLVENGKLQIKNVQTRTETTLDELLHA